MSRRKRYGALVLIACMAAAAGVLSGAGAGPGDELGLSDVATPNTRSTGYAPASKLSVELSQIAVAQGSTKLENLGNLISRRYIGRCLFGNESADFGSRS